MIVIESGVKPGETIVITGQLALSPGAKVDPKPYDVGNPKSDGQVAAKDAM